MQRVLSCLVGGFAIACGSGKAGLPDSPGPDDPADAAMPDADAPGSGTAITIRVFPEGPVSYTGVTENALFLAFQDGDGPWATLSGDAGIYHATATVGRYSVAVGCLIQLPRDFGIAANLDLYYLTVSDTADLPVGGCSRPFTDLVHVSVDLQGLRTEATEVWIGRSRGLGNAGAPVELDAHTGSVDVFARTQLFVNSSSPSVQVYRGATLELRADLDLVIDMAALQRPLESHPLTVLGGRPAEAPEEMFAAYADYNTRFSYRRWPVFFDDIRALPLAPPDHYMTLDPTMRRDGDLTTAGVDGFGTAADGRRFTRSAERTFKDVGPQTLELPPLATGQLPRVETVAGVVRATVELPTPPTPGRAVYEASFGSTGIRPDLHPRQRLFVLPGWVAGQSSVAITTPDLTQLPGWPAELGLSGEPIGGADIGWVERSVPLGTVSVDGKHVRTSFVSVR